MHEQMNPDRFRRFVERVATWTDDEVACVSPEQVRHIAQVVMGGADPIYPPFAVGDAECAE